MTAPDNAANSCLVMPAFFSLRTPHPTLDRWARHFLIATIFMVPISTAATNLFKFAMLASWLLAGGFAARWALLKRHPLAWGVVALYSVILISSLYSPAPLSAILFQWSKYNKMLFVLPALTLLQDEPARRRALLAFMGAMALTLAASYLHVFWAFPGAQATQAGVTNNHFVFKNHIEQNIMMSFFAMVCLYEALRGHQTATRAGLAALGFAAACNIVFLVSGRTGYLTLAACLCLLALVAVPARRRWPALLVVIALGSLAAFSSDNLRQRVTTALHEARTVETDGINTSSGQRLQFWMNSIELIEQKPLLGWGTGAYGRAFCGIASDAQWCRIGAESHPHNQTLYLGVESGALGMLALWALQLLPLWLARAYPPRERTFILGLTIILWIDGLFNVPLYAITEAFFFLMLLSVLLADYPARRQQAGDAPDQPPQVSRHGHEQA